MFIKCTSQASGLVEQPALAVNPKKMVHVLQEVKESTWIKGGFNGAGLSEGGDGGVVAMQEVKVGSGLRLSEGRRPKAVHYALLFTVFYI